ncbi:MAG: aminomethyl-transferring glycine dehydrogenase subunit GcvPA [Christensenellaceae bacterium]|nr:aminomethyl-transferring glycine dehydrogenase subunit GcvPA [Christensenellaceae bacterium]
MASFIPSTKEERLQMLKAVGLSDYRELYKDVPADMYLEEGDLNIPSGLSELEVSRKVSAMAAKNRVFSTVLRGAGAYDHYIPSIVKYIPAKEEFLTAYTPYQAEMSQGILQSIFEYQTDICELTGMDVSNASVYDGATAAAEAAAMCRDRKRRVTLISASSHPDVINTVRTYCYGTGDEMIVVPAKDGKTDISALKEMLNDSVSCVYVQQPNFFGLFEDAEAIGEAAHEKGAMFVLGCNPIALGIMKTPKEMGADIAVGEAQPLGMPLSYGGPYLGYMATTTKHMRKLPGRIVGQTVDANGERAFVLSLQAREQHIRREKASSNICSNQALCALTAGLYLAAMGPEGLKKAAVQSMSKAHYLAKKLCEIPGVSMAFGGEYFHEFVTVLPKSQEVLKALEDADILGGLPVEGGILWCATEKVSKEQLDKAVAVVKEVLGA